MKHLRALVSGLAIAGAMLLAVPARAQNYDSLTIPLIALSNSAQSIKASPGTLLGYSCFNPNSSAVFVQVYDSVSAVVVGTTVPKFNFRVPPTSSTGFVPAQNQGAYYASAGLQAAVTTAAGGATAPSLTVPCDFAVR